jgi:Transcriptional regulators
MLKASRPIIRSAMHILRDKGVLKITRGRPAEIIGPMLRVPVNEDKERVALLFVQPANAISQWSLMAVDEIRRGLAARGYQFELVVEPKASRGQPGKIFPALLTRYSAHHWILAGASAAVQEWFRQQPLNTITMGNAFSATDLPFVNDDLRGVTRHAASVFLGLGHRRIAFLMRQRGGAGETDEEEGFREAFRSEREAAALVLKHSGEVEQIRHCLRRAFSRPSSATALLVSHAEDTLVALNWFWENGIRLPKDASLISYQWESYLERLTPLPAWYYTDPRAHAKKLCRLIFNPPPDRKSPRLHIPIFVKNETLGPPSST